MSLLQRYFPLLAICASIAAYVWPVWLTQQKSWIVYLLGVVMFSMGASLTINHFKQAIQRYPLIILALILQFAFMPLIAWQLSAWAGLSIALSAGMVLVGSVPGGTASNVICYISKGDVALSITITAISTFIAVIATPLLAYIYLSQTIEIPFTKMVLSIFYIVLVPVSLGVALNHYLPKVISPIHKFGADISIIVICLIIAIIVALNKDNLAELSLLLAMLVIAHNILGLITGYFITLLITRDKILSKTIAIEVGMQNSGLAVALAVKFFGPASALPGALFSIVHNVTGSLAASYWAKNSN